MSEHYSHILDNYRLAPDKVERQLALYALSLAWQEQVISEQEAAKNAVYEETRDFYDDYEQLYDTANQTTGDTPKQLSDFARFVDKFSHQFDNETVIDIGCGDGKRITYPMASMLAKSQIVGIDHVEPTLTDRPENLQFMKGSFDNLPFDDNQVSFATAHWSVVNDLLLRSSQLDALKELKRVLKPGGLFYFDVPTLGGEHGYLEAAKDYNSKNPDSPFGMIEREFPGDRSKRFYIYPLAELEALLENFGLETIHCEEWVTSGQQSRATIAARLNK